MTRTAIPAAIKRAAWAKNDGRCLHPGCNAKGDILEHLIPWMLVQEHTLDNLEPRCIDHAKEKTRTDIKVIRKTTRMAGGYGSQYARRKKNGSKLQSGRKLKTPAGYKHRWPARKFETRKSQ